jgi:hypothetical protein
MTGFAGINSSFLPDNTHDGIAGIPNQFFKFCVAERLALLHLERKHVVIRIEMRSLYLRLSFENRFDICLARLTDPFLDEHANCLGGRNSGKAQKNDYAYSGVPHYLLMKSTPS